MLKKSGFFRGETGGVLILFVFALVAILSVIALNFESIKSATNLEQARNHMRLMSLAMLEGFMGTAGQYQDRFDAGIDRVRMIADSNNYLLALKGDSTAGKRASTIGAGGSVDVEAGIWGCEPGESGEACFDNSPSFNDNNLPNSFRIKGALFKSKSGLLGRRIFGNAVELGDANLTSIATVVPRQICFAVDLSSSMVRDTNRYWYSIQLDQTGQAIQCMPQPDATGIQFGAGLGGEFAYFLNNPNLPVYPAVTTFHQCSANYFFNPAANASWRANRDAALNASAAGGASTLLRSFPLPADYVLRLLYNDNDYGSLAAAIGGSFPDPADKYLFNPALNPAFSVTANNDYYLVNLFRGTRSETIPATGAVRSDTFSGPQPLGVVMAGLNSAINDLRSRRVAGDKACLIFFDSRIEWPRIVRLTDDFNFLDVYTGSFNRIPDNLGLTDIDPTNDLVNDSAVPATARGAGGFYPDFNVGGNFNERGFDFLVRMGIFPKVGRQSDYLGAIKQAMNMLVAERAVTNLEAQTSVVVIGDWIHNCLQADRNGEDAGCNNTFTKYREASEELLEWVDNVLLADGAVSNTPIHVMLVGDHVRPHTFEYEKQDGYCTNDKDLRQMGGTYKPVYVPASGSVGPSDIPGALGSRTWQQLFHDMHKPNGFGFFYPNFYARSIVEKTRGAWMPIRTNNTTFFGTESCATFNGQDFIPNDPSTLPQRYTDGKKGLSCQAYSGYGNRFTTFEFLLNTTRNPDPQCRSKEQQAIDFMKEIVTGNPYKIAFAN